MDQIWIIPTKSNWRHWIPHSWSGSLSRSWEIKYLLLRFLFSNDNRGKLFIIIVKPRHHTPHRLPHDTSLTWHVAFLFSSGLVSLLDPDNFNSTFKYFNLGLTKFAIHGIMIFTLLTNILNLTFHTFHDTKKN